MCTSTSSSVSDTAKNAVWPVRKHVTAGFCAASSPLPMRTGIASPPPSPCHPCQRGQHRAASIESRHDHLSFPPPFSPRIVSDRCGRFRRSSPPFFRSACNGAAHLSSDGNSPADGNHGQCHGFRFTRGAYGKTLCIPCSSAWRSWFRSSTAMRLPRRSLCLMHRDRCAIFHRNSRPAVP